MPTMDFLSVVSRVEAGLAPEMEWIYLEAAKQHAPLVESEIELMLALAFDMFARLTRTPLTIGDTFPEAATRHDLLLTPQFRWNDYRIDFCLRAWARPDRMVFVECDGHDFHERTKEQAERDRSKDRAIQAAGIGILRFTGREIWRDPFVVMLEILRFMCRS